MKTNYVYLRSEPGLYTVGFYDPSGKWHSESDHNDKEAAARRVAWLNGSCRPLPSNISEALNSGDGVYRP